MHLLTALLAFAGPALAGPDAAALRAAIEEYDTHAVRPIPVPTGEEMEALAAGELVRLREVVDPEKPQRAIGLQVLPFSKEELWVGTGDEHYTDVDSLTYVKVATIEGDHPGNRWYQHLDVPWPFADRHWVIDSVDNLDLVKATGGRMWEQSWALSDDGPALAMQTVAAGKAPGITPEMAEKAIYTPVNEGAWLAITLPDGSTLLGYHVTTVVGGAIPDDMVASWSLHTLRGVFSGAAARIPALHAHYDADHRPIIGGDHHPIAPFSTGAVASRAPAAP